ncbi:hypothetical protein GCM10023323_11120 [Streptomyces thinghirensis]|uniref:Uncharacterized protein n=1 Tax=Streptomyces thinghirensis TaxID=551547 RepID=A0ABP9SWA1_9ACTN
MTPTTAQAGLDAVILDYNGVIGLQPTTGQWLRLARTALWSDDSLPAFQHAFWSARSEQRCLASARVGCRPWSGGALPHSTSAVPSVWTRADVGCSPLPSSLSAGAAATRALRRTIYDRDLRSEANEAPSPLPACP